VHYRAVGHLPNPDRIITEKVVGCRIKKADDAHQEGEEALKVKVDLHALYIVRNGQRPMGVKQFLP
jgi:hypothetical protein